MLNRYEPEDAEPLMDSVRDVLGELGALIERAEEAGVQIVYVSDNHDDWTAGPRELVAWARGGEHADLVEPIVPPTGVPFVVKSRHSIFYATQLEALLRQHEVDELVLAGPVTEQSILYSALDAYVRHFEVAVPRRAVAHIHPDLAEVALRMMERNMGARIVESPERCFVRG